MATMESLFEKTVNCTPHPIEVIDDQTAKEGGKFRSWTFPKSAHEARLIPEEQKHLEYISEQFDGVPIWTEPKYVGLEGLPDINKYPHPPIIVSMLVADVLKRQESYAPQWNGPILVPDTGPQGVIRDPATGAIKGTKRLVRYA